MPLFSPGVARVDDGFIVCGGNCGKDCENRECWIWTLQNRKYEKIDSLPHTGPVTLANHDTAGILRNEIVAFFQESGQIAFGHYKTDHGSHSIQWRSRGGLFGIDKESCLTVYGRYAYLFGGLNDENEATRSGFLLNETYDEQFNLRSSRFCEKGGRSQSACATRLMQNSRRPKFNVITLVAGGTHNCSMSLDVADSSNGVWIKSQKLPWPVHGGAFAFLNNEGPMLLTGDLRLGKGEDVVKTGPLIMEFTNRRPDDTDDGFFDIRMYRVFTSYDNVAEDKVHEKSFHGIGSAVVEADYFTSCGGSGYYDVVYGRKSFKDWITSGSSKVNANIVLISVVVVVFYWKH